MPGCYFGRRYAAQVKERETKGWRQERGLQVQSDHNAEPDRIQIHLQQDWRHNRHNDEGDLDEV